ncbi:hypothetical protein J4G08_07350 [Candidatus Poribacteria bacterium]|nr:hypothetical protein [Candidatus Poribacteria bacterium]
MRIDAPDVWQEGAHVPIAGGHFDFSVKLPTDAELPKYSGDELTKLVYEANSELSKAQRKYETQSRSLVEAAGAVDMSTRSGVVKWRDLLKQERELGRVYRLRRAERNERIRRIQQYIDTLE